MATTKGVSAKSMSNDFAESKIKYRGVTYVMRELPMDEYDDLVKQATAEKTIDGLTEDVFDNALHTKLLTAASLVSPKLTTAQLYKKGTRLVRAIQGAVLKLHLDPEPVEADADADDEGEASEAPASE